MRLWLFDDLVRLVRDSGRLRLEAIYDDNYRELAQHSRITGEMGNLYFVLKAL